MMLDLVVWHHDESMTGVQAGMLRDWDITSVSADVALVDNSGLRILRRPWEEFKDSSTEIVGGLS